MRGEKISISQSQNQWKITEDRGIPHWKTQIRKHGLARGKKSHVKCDYKRRVFALMTPLIEKLVGNTEIYIYIKLWIISPSDVFSMLLCYIETILDNSGVIHLSLVEQVGGARNDLRRLSTLDFPKNISFSWNYHCDSSTVGNLLFYPSLCVSLSRVLCSRMLFSLSEGSLYIFILFLILQFSSKFSEKMKITFLRKKIYAIFTIFFEDIYNYLEVFCLFLENYKKN